MTLASGNNVRGLGGTLVHRLLAPLLAAAAIFVAGVPSAPPASAAVACRAVPNTPFKNGGQVTASGYGWCTSTVEALRVQLYLYRVRPDFKVDLIGNRSETCGLALRCPKFSGAYAVSGPKAASCRNYYLRADVDVMYKGIPLWYHNVDIRSTPYRWIC